ncbi:MAG: sugar-binding transcriptional regulator [Chloroflexi bacterium]|nr:sugar-binding transcriptional regulator [Chloroflexota bacterium]
MDSISGEHRAFLARVASMYYLQDMTQAEIARRINVSRSTVSRLLSEARATGVVEITIHYLWERDQHLENDLKEEFGLRNVRVLMSQGRSYEEVLEGLGILAAEYLEGLPGLNEKAIVGIGWGTGVRATVEALHVDGRRGVTVVQMIGAVGTGDPQTDGTELARRMAQAWGGQYRYLHAPLIVESARVRDAFLSEPRITETLDLARQAQVALVGIGSPIREVASLLRAGYLDEAALHRQQEWGVAGDVCGHPFDVNGKPLETDLNRRLVGIELESLRRIPQVVGVAGGEIKAAAILGALRGGHLHVLVTDDAAARRVLELNSM